MEGHKLIIDVHGEFLKRAREVLLKVKDGSTTWMQSFIISLVVRDLWTRNHALVGSAEAIARTKEELAKLCEQCGLELGDLEAFMVKVSRSGVI